MKEVPQERDEAPRGLERTQPFDGSAARRGGLIDSRHDQPDGWPSLTDAANPLLGERYQLEERLGCGGMGAVYRARHVLLKSTHAV